MWGQQRVGFLSVCTINGHQGLGGSANSNSFGVMSHVAADAGGQGDMGLQEEPRKSDRCKQKTAQDSAGKRTTNRNILHLKANRQSNVAAEGHLDVKLLCNRKAKTSELLEAAKDGRTVQSEYRNIQAGCQKPKTAQQEAAAGVHPVVVVDNSGSILRRPACIWALWCCRRKNQQAFILEEQAGGETQNNCYNPKKPRRVFKGSFNAGSALEGKPVKHAPAARLQTFLKPEYWRRYKKYSKRCVEQAF